MRILIFLPCFTNGGAEKQGSALAHALKEAGHYVTVWAFPPFGEISNEMINSFNDKGIDFFQLSNWPKIKWDFENRKYKIRKRIAYLKHWKWYIFKLRQNLPDRRFDVIIPFTFYPCLVTVLVKNKLAAKTIIWNHRGGFDPAGINYNSYLVSKILEAKPVFVANSLDGAKFLMHTFGLDQNEVEVVHNIFVPGNTEDCKLDISNSTDISLQLLHIANFFPEKDIDTLLKGISILKKSNIDCHLHIVGHFLQKNDEESFYHNIQSLEIENLITYHGPLDREKTINLLSKSHVGVLSSRTEGMPNSVMEYMYWRLPVIATNIPGIRDVVGKEQEFLLFEVGDYLGFSEKVKWIVHNLSKVDSIGESNRKRIIEEYSKEKILPNWFKILKIE